MNKKKIIIVGLCSLILAMALGYALLAQQLTITGTADITSNWQVEITDVREITKVGKAYTKSTSYTATTANFSVGLINTTDSITYEITITNKGTLDAVLAAKPIVTTTNDEVITYKISGLRKGMKLPKNNGTAKLTVVITYNENITSQPLNTTSDIEVTLNYQQDLGQVPPNEAYSIGDTVEFAGSNWKVIKNSTVEEDYVTLMKERVLTNAELGDYAYSSTSDTMEYTWNDTCHNANHGYSSKNTSNCNNINNYEASKVKEMLEQRYLPTIGSSNLKEVDGYKIRLITLEELQDNLGLSRTIEQSWYNFSVENTPIWVYQDFGEGQNNVYAYWTMTPGSNFNDNARVWSVSKYHGQSADSGNYWVSSDRTSVRPVINLLKSAIE